MNNKWKKPQALREERFDDDVPELLTFAPINNGIITAEFYFVKRGSDYGIKLRTN